MAFKEHEKFWAFFALLLALVFLAWMSNGQGSASNTLRDAIIGIIGILGVAAQSLFRVNENAKEMNELLRQTVEKLGNSMPLETTPPKEIPINVQEAVDQVAGAAVAEAEAITNATTDRDANHTPNIDGAATTSTTPSDSTSTTGGTRGK